MNKSKIRTKLRFRIMMFVLIGALFSSISFVYAQTAEDYVNRGKLDAKQGNYDQAISDYTKAIDIDPKYARAYDNRGYVYAGQGNLSQAISDYTQAIKINPKSAEAYTLRGAAYLQQSNFRQAISNYTKAIEINPDIGKTYLARGYTYAIMKEYDKYLQDIQKGEELDFSDYQKKAQAWRQQSVKPPLSEEARRFRVLAEDAYQSNDFEKAVGFYEKGLAIDPLWSAGQFNAALIYGELNNYNLAVMHMKRYLALNPDAKDARAYQDKIYIWQEKFNEVNASLVKSNTQP